MLQYRTLNSYFSQWGALSVFSERISIVSSFLLIRLVGCLCTYISDIDNQLPGKPSFIKGQRNRLNILVQFQCECVCDFSPPRQPKLILELNGQLHSRLRMSWDQSWSLRSWNIISVSRALN